MRLLTSQHINVWNKIIEDGIYQCTISSNTRERTINSYNKMANAVKEKTGIEVLSPIWCWFRVDDKYINTIKETNLKRCDGMTGVNEIVMLLEVPDEIPLLSDFYEWVDVMYQELTPNDPLGVKFEDIFDIREDVSIQACIPYIKKEYIIEAYRNESSSNVNFEDLTQIYLKKIQ